MTKDSVIFLGISRQITGEYHEIGYDCLLPNLYLFTVDSHVRIWFGAI